MKKLALILATTPLFASAGLFRLVGLNITGGTLDGQEAAVTALIEQEVNKNLPSADTEAEYFNGMSEANAMSAAGVTTSYGTVFDKFLVGVTVSGGAHLGSKSLSDFGDIGKDPEKLRGFGAQAAIVAGINVGNIFGWDNAFFDPRKLKLYVSGFALDRKFGDVSADYMGMGLGVQYRLFDETNWAGRSLKWTGVDIGTGVLYSKLDVVAALNLSKNYTGTVAGQSVDAQLTNTVANLNAKVNTVSIPLEISTGLRILYFFKLIAGAGVDFNFGNTKGTGSLNNGAGITGTAGGGTIDAGTPTFSLNGSKGPDFLNARVFAGPHIEFGVGSVFANVHKSVFKNAVAVNAGLNLFW